jgi:membrane protein
MNMLAYFRIPVGWSEILKRTGKEILEDDVLSLAAELAYYFFLALFPALLFLVALASFLPVENVIDDLTNRMSGVAPPDVIQIVREQLTKIAAGEQGGLLTVGMLLTLWSSSAGVMAIINTLNRAYDIQEGRPWWKVRLTAIALTIALATFILVSFALVIVGPQLAERVAGWVGLGQAFVWTWWILQWPVVFVLITAAMGIIYYFAPDAEQDWVWLTPGSVVATALWILFSLGFRIYVTNFTNYNETYGAIGGVIVLLLWFYATGLAILIGAELNAEIEHASPYGKEPGEKVPGEKRKIGPAAERAWEEEQERERERGEPLRPAAAVVRPLQPRTNPLIVMAGGIVAGVLELIRRRKTGA